MIENRKTPLRRIACNELITPEGQCLTLCVVELSDDGQVVRHYSLSKELPHTEWWQGRLNLRRDGDGIVRAYYKDKAITKKERL